MNRTVRFLAQAALFLFITKGIHGQGITVISRLEQQPGGSLPVAVDSSTAILFRPGHGAGAYRLESAWVLLQPNMGKVSGLSAVISAGPLPPEGRALPLGPPFVAGGGRVWFDGQGALLQPGGFYWLVLTARQPLTEGAYQWSYARPGGAVIRVGDWVDRTVTQSADGLAWKTVGLAGSLQYALMVTPIPEPSPLALFGLGGLLLLAGRRRNIRKR